MFGFNKNTLFFLLSLGILVPLYYYFDSEEEKAFRKSARYTIGEITELSSSTHGIFMSFSYKAKGKKYYSGGRIPNEREAMFRPGKRIFIMYAVHEPENCSYVSEIFPSDSLIAPANGWKKLPVMPNGDKDLK